ncbi:hypothetical protein Q5424_15485 [Conexibacter sp. JD483]|uniref:hypothetical protein n=1 Tax=unclassified Conexibacter TaxID=2627773 RepID=UPI00271BE62C|nr:MULTISPECIES: hypothetical protein [unclassified Conexibacter]MDO8185702.1 hypothetical protein [Conexibacter sp. CPCC 205706]MDO8199079.1 hypothetical protein [Conexibacter sp. CPCC 205762]MDR9370502.1 hypothetical protein [Conexibacter sp. JD483]
MPARPAPSPRSRRLAGAAACIALAGLLPSATADVAVAKPAKPAMPAKQTLQVQSVRIGGASAPVVVRLRLPRTARLHAWVNGRRADGSFRRQGANERVGDLTAHDGLRFGDNRLRLRARLRSGRVLVATRRMNVRRPLADAGRDATTLAGRGVEVGVEPVGMQGAQRRHRWRIAKAPRGAKPKLADARTATPQLTPDRPGTYVLQLTAGDGRASSRDTLTVVARPDDPPIGVPLVTLSSDPAAGVWIDGKPVPNTYDRNGIFVVVLERRTRAVVEAGTTPRHGGGITQLLAMVDDYAHNTDTYMMIVASAQGTTSDVGGPLKKLFGKLGATDVTDAQIDAITAGTPFSLVGIPGGLPGAAWTKLPPKGSSAASASIAANLQLNQATAGVAPPHYDVAPLNHPTFDTRVGTPGATSNTIRWNGVDYAKTLPAGATAGFHTMIIDPYTGAVLDDNPLTSNGSDTNNQVKVAADWLKGYLDRKPAPLVIMQSIGRPSARADNWNALVDQMVRIGGNRYVINALDGQNDSYALVGRPGAAAPAAESSTKTGEHGDLNGVASPDRSLQLTPVAADPFGRLNTEVVEVAYQRAVPFPAFSAEQKKAETWIAIRLGFCNTSATSCEMRRRYYENYAAANWNQKATDLGKLTWPGADSGFGEADFRAVKTQLDAELSAVANVEHWFTTLQAPFDRTTGKSILDLNDLSDRLRSEFAAPTGDATTSWALGLVSEIAAVGGSVESSVSGGLSGMSAVFSLASYLTQENGKSILGDEITTKAGQLGHELYDRYDLAQQATTGIALLVVSDWGKLQAAAGKVDNDWRLPATMGTASAQLKLSAKRWFAESLVPTAFPYLLRATPKPVGSGTAVGTECMLRDNYGNRWFSSHPWDRIDGGASVGVTELWENGGRRTTTLWPTRDFNVFPKSASISDLLFRSETARDPGLGLSRLAFFSPDNFGGRIWSANDRAKRCDLPFKE